MTKSRIHIATGDPISRRGGLHTVASSIANAQYELGFDSRIVDQINTPYLLRNFVSNSNYSALNSTSSKLSYPDSLIEYHFAQTALLTFPLFASKKMPRIFHFHGPWFLEGKVQGNGSLRALAKRSVEVIVYRSQAVMTTHSEAFKEVLLEEFGVPESRVKVVYPGVDLSKFKLRDKEMAREHFNFSPDKKVILCIRRLEPRMGIHLAIEALEHLEDSILVIAGTGSLDNRLRELANSKSYHERIQFLGRVEEEEHGLLFNAADVVIVPTLSFEGFGLVVWEALASGVPVVASRVGGLPEALGNFRDDFSFETGSIDDLVEKVNYALNCSKPQATFRAEVIDRTWHKTALEIESIAERIFGEVD